MSPIELTDLHKSKLLEMCKALFPEYTFEFPGNFSDWNVVRVNKIGQDEIFENIHHWFEFCMTKLVDKLYDSINYTDSDEFNINLHVDLMLDMVNFKINPIDTLYKEFLKTKINNK